MRQLWRVLPSFSSVAQRERAFVTSFSGRNCLPQHQQFFPPSTTFAPLRCLWISASASRSSLCTNFGRISLMDSTSSRISLLSQIEQRRAYASKLKNYKIKSFSSFKFRFREKANGEYKRWRAGKRHNAHSKTNKQLRQLRRPSVVPSAYAKVMKKLNFHG